MTVPAASKWPCANRQECTNNLGFVVNGELSLDKGNIGPVTTDGVNLVITCGVCGRQKTWFAKGLSIEDSFVKLIMDKVGDRLEDSVRAILESMKVKT